MAAFIKFDKPCIRCGSILRYASSGRCGACQKKRNQDYAASEVGKNQNKIRRKQYRKHGIGAAHHLRNAAKGRAAKAGLDFNLDVETLANRINKGCCEVTGLPFVHDDSRTTFKNPFAPSIDRIDNSKGYVWSNVQVVCHIYNMAKNEFSDADVLTMALSLAKVQHDKAGKVHQL